MTSNQHKNAVVVADFGSTHVKWHFNLARTLTGRSIKVKPITKQDGLEWHGRLMGSALKSNKTSQVSERVWTERCWSDRSCKEDFIYFFYCLLVVLFLNCETDFSVCYHTSGSLSRIWWAVTDANAILGINVQPMTRGRSWLVYRDVSWIWCVSG